MDFKHRFNVGDRVFCPQADMQLLGFGTVYRIDCELTIADDGVTKSVRTRIKYDHCSEICRGNTYYERHKSPKLFRADQVTVSYFNGNKLMRKDRTGQSIDWDFSGDKIEIKYRGGKIVYVNEPSRSSEGHRYCWITHSDLEML